MPRKGQIDDIIDELLGSAIAEARAIGELLSSVREGGGRPAEILATLKELIEIAQSVIKDLGGAKAWEPKRR